MSKIKHYILAWLRYREERRTLLLLAKGHITSARILMVSGDIGESIYDFERATTLRKKARELSVRQYL